MWKWRHEVVTDVIKQKYVTQFKTEIHNALADYFEGTWSGDKSMPHGKNTMAKRPPVFVFVQLHELKNKDCINRRRLDEVPYHLYCLKRGGPLSHKLLQYSWLRYKLEGK